MIKLKIRLKKLPFVEVEFRYKKTKGSKAFWDFSNDIPPLKTVASPLSEDWTKRVEEEIKTFEIWRKFNPNIPVRNLQYSSERRFTVEFDLDDLFNSDLGWRKVTILIPLTYPYKMPSIGDPSREYWFAKLLRSWTGGRPFCIPRVMHLWWNKLKGHAGIAHFLHIFIVFVTIAGKKSSRLSESGYIIDI